MNNLNVKSNNNLTTTKIKDILTGGKEMKNRQQGVKRKTESRIISALLISFFSFFILSACVIELSNVPQDSDLFKAGQGYFTLRLSDNTSRTILPDAPVLNQFKFFELVFIPVENNEGVTTGEEKTVIYAYNASADTPAVLPAVLLAAGTYDITVNAYLNGTIEVPAQLAARGILNAVTINPGASIERNITLKGLLSEGTGRFNWSASIDVSIEDFITEAVMTIMQGSTHYGNSPIDLKTITGGNPTLNAGIYNVSFKLVKEITSADNPTEKYEVIWNELLYVYSSLTSNFSITFDDSFFYRTQYNVTFIFNDGDHVYKDNATLDGIKSVLHGDTINNGAISMPEPISEGYRFDGWFRNSDFSGTTWNLDDDQVMEDITLYAKWTQNRITITLLDVDNIQEGVEHFTFSEPIIISRTGANNIPKTKSIAITGTYTSILWKIQGKGVYATQSASGTVSPIILDAENPIYNSLGWHTVELTVEKGEQKYQTGFRFRIVN